MVSPPAVCPALEERRSSSVACTLHRLPGSAGDCDHVVSVHGARGQAEGGGTRSDALAGGHRIRRGELRITVVLTHKERGDLPEHRQVQRLEEDALIGRSVPEERDCDRARPEPPGGECETDRVRDSPADDAVRAHGALGDRAHVHRPPFATAVTAGPAEDLGEHPSRIQSARKHVVVATVGRGDLVSGSQRRADAHGSRLLPDRKVDYPDESSPLVEIGERLFEEANSEHHPKPLRCSGFDDAAHSVTATAGQHIPVSGDRLQGEL